MKTTNIAIFSDSYYPLIDGVVRFVDRLAIELHKAGYRVTLVVPKYNHQPNISSSSRPFEFLFLPTVPLYVKGYYPVLPTPKLYSIISKADLLIINSLAFTAIYCHLLNKKFNKPVIEFVHADERLVINKTTDFPSSIKNLVFNMMRNMTAEVDYFAVATNTFEKRTIDYGAEKSKIFRVPFGYSRFNVTESDIQNVADQLGIDRTKRIILYLGRLSNEKNIDTTFEVMKQLTMSNANVQGVIAGGGYRYHDLKRKIVRNKYNIIVTGRIAEDYLPALYSMCDIFYTPSDHEALCFTVIEAMHYTAIPVINGKFQERELTDQNAILLEDVHDIIEAVEKIQYLLDHGSEIKKLKNGVKNTTSLFSWSRFAHIWKNKIDEVLTTHYQTA